MITEKEEKIGLMSLSDWYYAFNENGSQKCNSGSYCKSWMADATDSRKVNNPINYEEYTINNFPSSIYNRYTVWDVGYIGSSGNGSMDIEEGVRPVFYVKDEVRSGNGSIDNPFIIG